MFLGAHCMRFFLRGVLTSTGMAALVLLAACGLLPGAWHR